MPRWPERPKPNATSKRTPKTDEPGVRQSSANRLYREAVELGISELLRERYGDSPRTTGDLFKLSSEQLHALLSTETENSLVLPEDTSDEAELADVKQRHPGLYLTVSQVSQLAKNRNEAGTRAEDTTSEPAVPPTRQEPLTLDTRRKAARLIARLDRETNVETPAFILAVAKDSAT